MGIWGRVKSILSGHFDSLASQSGRPDFVWPGSSAPIEEHVRYLINSRDFVANYPVPSDSNYRQYIHNSESRAVGNDPSKPAITDCCYDHFDMHYLSVGFPFHVPSDDNFFKPNGGGFRDDIGFSRPMYQDSLYKVLKHIMGDDSIHGDKVGYQIPTHWYIECHASSKDSHDMGRRIIDELVHSTTTNPRELLEQLTMRAQEAPNAPIIFPTASNIPAQR